MKRFLYLSLAALMTLTVSCNKDKPAPDVPVVVPEEAVDLGIVMTREDGTKYKLYWAKSNLSTVGLCANPEDAGDYYAWGEVLPYYLEGHSQDNPCYYWRTGKSGYSWETYIWSSEGGDKLTRYCTVESLWDGPGELDGKTEFSGYGYADDAARVTLHGKWRVPTDAEWDALLNECEWTWTEQNGKNGWMVTGSNGNSIFLPAAGFWTISNSFIGLGTHGAYWSSTISSEGGPRLAIGVGITKSTFFLGSAARISGHSVRPVWEE